MEAIKSIARALLKLALFIAFTYLLLGPLAAIFRSFWTHQAEPTIIQATARTVGVAFQITCLYFSMLISCFITQKLKKLRLLRFAIGLAIMAAAYYLSENAMQAIIAWMTVLIGGMVVVALIVIVSSFALYYTLWVVVWPWLLLHGMTIEDIDTRDWL